MLGGVVELRLVERRISRVGTEKLYIFTRQVGF